MKLEEATKKATPGPLGIKCVPTSIGRCWKINGAEQIDEDHGCACLYDSDTSLNPKSSKEIAANAALLAHWYNVGPKLLEALHAILSSTSWADIPKTAHDQATNAIAEAEEVEGI